MNRERAKELLPIIQAFAEGGTIQLKRYGGWENLQEDSSANFSEHGVIWRVKPEPFECWVCMDHDGGNSAVYMVDQQASSRRKVIHMREIE